MWRGTGGERPREQGAGGVRETTEKRAGGRREIQKGKRSLLITAYDPVQKTNPATFFDFHLTFSEASNKVLYARKRKFVLGLKNRITFGEIGNLFKVAQSSFLIFLILIL